MTNGNLKGKEGERDAAKALNAIFGTHARRGQQFKGGSDSPDVVGALPGVHIEVKRTESIRLKEWEKQVNIDAAGQPKMILHRYNRGKWWAMIPLADLPGISKSIQSLEENNV